MLITSRRAAELLGVSQPTLLRAVRAGQLKPSATTKGGHYRFSEEALLKWGRAHGMAAETIELSPRLFTSSGLADRLRVSHATVLRMVQKGLIRPSSLTPGGHYRFTPQDVAVAAVALTRLAASEPVVSGSAVPVLAPEHDAEVPVPELESV